MPARFRRASRPRPAASATDGRASERGETAAQSEPRSSGAPRAAGPASSPAPRPPAPPKGVNRPASAAATVTRREQRRVEQALALQQRQSGLQRWGWLLLGVGAVIVVAAIVVIIIAVVRSNQPPAPLNEVYQAPTGSQHVAEGTKVDYPDTPPSSGPHYPTPADWGIYPQALLPERWVHNLEHGGIVILYSCPTNCSQLQQQLDQVHQHIPKETLFREQKVVITPYAPLDHLLRVQAWGWTMPLDSVNSAAILSFYNEHVDKGPEQIP